MYDAPFYAELDKFVEFILNPTADRQDWVARVARLHQHAGDLNEECFALFRTAAQLGIDAKVAYRLVKAGTGPRVTPQRLAGIRTRAYKGVGI